GSRPIIDEALSHFAIEADIVKDSGNPATLFPMVEEGIGISMQPPQAIPLPQCSHLKFKRITPVYKKQLILARLKNR
ncbi:LysR family transcriptional regulator, partial [Salmonella enterica subsp. enterica serovar Infantis]